MNSISTKIYLLCQFFIITGLYAGSSVESAPKNANHQAVLSERPFNIEYLVEEVIMNKGQADGMQFYNLDSLGASLKGFSSHYLKILYDLCPHTLISAFDLGQLSDHEKTALFAVLPMLPQDIRESTTPLIISLFVLSAGALCRMNHIYIYATHPKMSDDTPPDAKQNFAIEHIFQPEKLESDHEHFACLQNFLLEEDRIVRGISFEQERDSKQLHIVRLFKSYEDYFQYFADRGIIRAALMCGILKLSSGKNPEDDKEALTYFQKAAKFEDAHGQYYVGLMHYNGYGIRRDKNIAYEYFKRSAESGNIPAMYELAQLLDRGEGCTIDRDEATRYFTQAADLGDRQSQYVLGKRYLKGPTIHINKALHYLMRAAKALHPDALFDLGLLYARGQYVAKDQDKAIASLLQAHWAGHVDAKNHLIIKYRIQPNDNAR